MKILRSTLFERLADLGNGCKLESYWPDDEHHPEPLIYVRQGASAAPLKLDQVEQLHAALGDLLTHASEAKPAGEPTEHGAVDAYCQECADEDGRLQVVEQRNGAWWCPKHRDLCHIRPVKRAEPIVVYRPVGEAEGLREALRVIRDGLSRDLPHETARKALAGAPKEDKA